MLCPQKVKEKMKKKRTKKILNPFLHIPNQFLHRESNGATQELRYLKIPIRRGDIWVTEGILFV